MDPPPNLMKANRALELLVAILCCVRPLSPEAIAALGGASAGKLPVSNAAIRVTNTTSTDFYRALQLQPDIRVGQLPNSEQSLPSKQILRAPGRQLQFGGRPVDLALSPDGRTVFIKNMTNLLVVEAASWSLRQTLNYPASGASMHGIAVSRDSSHVYVTGANNELYDWAALFEWRP